MILRHLTIDGADPYERHHINPDSAALYARLVANDVKVLSPYDGDGGEFRVEDSDRPVWRFFSAS
jgi:hypothetical protein